LVLFGGQRLCMSSVTVTPSSRIARFDLRKRFPATASAPPLELLLSAPGYRAAATLPARGVAAGLAVAFDIASPKRTVIGTACLRNLGRTQVSLEATSDRTTSRSVMTVDGSPVAGNVTLRFIERQREPRLTHLAAAFEDISNLTDDLVPVWLVWMLAACIVFAVPISVVAALYRALREDEVAEAA
jgi:hypothetical protein